MMAQPGNPPPPSGRIPYRHFPSSPCLWPGKVEENSKNPWDPARMWVTWMKLWAPGFG